MAVTKVEALAGVSKAGACCRNPERSEGPLNRTHRTK
jgi:hypothetical protein